MKKNNKTGFTLVELVVVVTIIMVITAVGAISFQNANAKSRDGRRRADLEKIRLALEMVRQVGDTYPLSQAALSPDYLPSWPDDPKTGWDYVYVRNTTSNYKYDLYARLEGEGTDLTLDCGLAKCNYTVSNP